MLAALTMPTSHYLVPRGHSESLQDDLPGGSSASPPPTVPYTSQELDPFSVSGVSPFNYPAATDPTLLTPVSGAGSPPLHQRTATKVGGYHSTQSAVSSAQGPTPPNTSRMYYSSYDLSSSQSPSPITVHPQVTEATSFMNHFVTTHSPPAHHPSPRDDLPPQPIDPYLPYVVSATEVEMYGQSNYNPSATNPEYGRTQGPPSESAAAPQLAQLAPTASLLNSPHRSSYRPLPAASGIPNIRGAGMLPGPPIGFSSHGSISSVRRPQLRKRPRQPKASRAVKNHNPSTGASRTADGSAVQKESITLADGCSADDKRLFALRLKYDHIKGKGMWEKIGEEFVEGAAGKGREALQMRVHRMVAKYGVWPDAEERRLVDAFDWCEANYTRLVLQRLKETGGCQCWDWKPEHIETKLVKKGLMEATLDEKTSCRKRRKGPRRRPPPGLHYPTPMHGVMGGDWSTGLGLQPAFHRPMQQSYDMLSESAHVPTAQDPVSDELLDQIFNSGKAHFKNDADGCVTPEAMDLSYHDAAAAGASSSAPDGQALTVTHSSSQARREEQSTRLARQVVSQYLDDDQYRGGRT